MYCQPITQTKLNNPEKSLKLPVLIKAAIITGTQKNMYFTVYSFNMGVFDTSLLLPLKI